MSTDKFKSWFKDAGVLNEEGQRATIDFRSDLENLLAKDEVREMTFAELQTLGSNLHKLIGDAISNKISSRMQFANALEQMTDEQFVAYLRAKHGELWSVLTLLPEEIQRKRSLKKE